MIVQKLEGDEACGTFIAHVLVDTGEIYDGFEAFELAGN